jgi:hypothetical protein
MTRVSPPPPSAAPLYSIGTAVRIERMRLYYRGCQITRDASITGALRSDD